MGSFCLARPDRQSLWVRLSCLSRGHSLPSWSGLSVQSRFLQIPSRAVRTTSEITTTSPAKTSRRSSPAWDTGTNFDDAARLANAMLDKVTV